MLSDFLIVLVVISIVVATIGWANPLSADVFRRLVMTLGGPINFAIVLMLIAVVIAAWVQNLRVLT